MLLKLDGEGPIYEQVYRAIRTDILSGRLRAGERIPATRELAAVNGFSRNRAVLAYEQLLLEGYLVGRLGSGTYVAPELPERLSFVKDSLDTKIPERLASVFWSRAAERIASEVPRWTTRRSSQRYTDAAPLRYDFRYGRLCKEDVPLQTWQRLLAARGRSAAVKELDYGDPAGARELRTAISEYVRRARGVRCTPDQVVVVNGSQHGLELVSRLLVDPGDPVVVEEAHYPGARAAFLAAGARLVPIPVDREGMNTAKLGRVSNRARVAYVTPSHQYPLGGVMPLHRRLALLAWAEEVGAYVVEDDYDSEFRYTGRPLESLQGIDRSGRVIYLGSLSKLLFPGLRLGYVVLPEPLVENFVTAKAIADSGSPTLEQLALADFVGEGYLERHLRRLRARNAVRHSALTEAIEEHLRDRVEVWGSGAGLHMVLWLPQTAPDRLEAVVDRAAAAGVGVYPVNPFYLRSPPRTGLLLGFSALSPRSIRNGIRILATVLE